MTRKPPTVRIHLWLESDDDTLLGSGRVFLLDLIEKHGSLRKAARCLGMSYRAAWGKLQASEKALGVKLVETSTCKRDGCQLSEAGRRYRDLFKLWFQLVEQEAIDQAKSIFPWQVLGFDEAHAPLPKARAITELERKIQDLRATG